MSQVTFFSHEGRLFANEADCKDYEHALDAYEHVKSELKRYQALFFITEREYHAAELKSCGRGILPFTMLDPGCAGHEPIKATETQAAILESFFNDRTSTYFVHGGPQSGKTKLVMQIIAKLLNTTRSGNPVCIGFLGYNARVAEMFVERLRESLNGEFRTSSLGIVTMANGNQLRVIDKADTECIQAYSWDYCFMDTQPKDIAIIKEMQCRVQTKNGKVFIAFDGTKLSKEVTDFIEDHRKNSARHEQLHRSDVIFTMDRSDFAGTSN